MNAKASKAGTAIVVSNGKGTRKPVTVKNDGKGLTLTDLDSFQRLFVLDPSQAWERVAFVCELKARGFSSRAIADGMTVRTGIRPTGWNHSTVADLINVGAVMVESAPRKGIATDEQRNLLAGMLSTLVGVDEAHGGRKAGLDKAGAAIKASASPAGAVKAVSAIVKAATTKRSTAIATPPNRAPQIGAQGGQAPAPAAGQAPAPQAPQTGGQAPQAPAPQAPAPAADSIHAASFGNLMNEVAKRVRAKGFSILATDRKAFDEIARLIESAPTVGSKAAVQAAVKASQ